MSLALLATVGGLTTIGLYLITARSLSRIILGFTLLGHAAVIALITAGGPPGAAPIVSDGGAFIGDEPIANPLPQALALTAIVISFGLTLFLLALAGRQQELSGDDLVEDDIEDRRIAMMAEAGDTLDAVDDEHDDADQADGEDAGGDGTGSNGARADEPEGPATGSGESTVRA